MHGALAILRKDLRIEWRTRESLTSFTALGVLLLVVFTVAHDPDPEAAPALAPAVLWATFVLTGLLGVQRSFLIERENDCLAGLLTAPIDPGAIYAGKLVANVGLLAAMQALVVPLVGLFLHVDLGFPPFHPWPTFNIADSGICVGFAILVLLSFRKPT